MPDLNGSVFIVTGASGNLGQAVTRTFAAAGARLALVDRSVKDNLEDIFPALKDAPERYLAVAADLTNATAVADMVAQVAAHFGRIDGLINVAGGFRAGSPVHELDLDTWDFMLNVNARSVLLTSRAAIPHLIQAGGGRIVNIGAKAALAGGANMAAYSASKSAVLRLTEGMAAELKGHNINVNAILPGTIDTPQNRKAMPKADPSKWVAPEALADVILFLCSEASRAVTGALIPVYGKG